MDGERKRECRSKESKIEGLRRSRDINWQRANTFGITTLSHIESSCRWKHEMCLSGCSFVQIAGRDGFSSSGQREVPEQP
ncbi:unnamed protein product, partial [Onchocerca ochengi]|uniref:Uncharacterized protein n=1 Tax=Onchocerca ochengi TaxID=42157 RepID=A0A182F0C4_ONCOC